MSHEYEDEGSKRMNTPHREEEDNNRDIVFLMTTQLTDHTHPVVSPSVCEKSFTRGLLRVTPLPELLGVECDSPPAL
jgi:hypothetical protein